MSEESEWMKCPYSLEDVLHVSRYATVYNSKTARGRRLAIKAWHDDDESSEMGILERDVYSMVNEAYPSSNSFPRMREAFDHLDERCRRGYRVLNVFDYIPGKTLYRVLRSRSQLAPDTVDAGLAIATGLSLCSSLSKLHSLKIGEVSVSFVHRDVRPRNVIIRPDGRFVLLDLAGMTYDGDTSSVFFGCLPYSPPEAMYADAPLTPSLDVFSLAVTVYETATRHNPFLGTSDEEIMDAVRRRNPEHICGINSSAPASLDEAVRKAMQKLPEKRLATVQEFRHELAKAKRDYERKHGKITRQSVAEFVAGEKTQGQVHLWSSLK